MNRGTLAVVMAKPTNGPSGSRAATGDRSSTPATPASGRGTGRISTPTARTTQAARTAPSARTGRSSPTLRRDEWPHRNAAGTRTTRPVEHPDGRERPAWRPVKLDGDGRPPMSPSTRRMYQRRRRSMLLAFLLVSAVVLVISQLTGHPGAAPDKAAAPTVRPAAPTVAPTTAAAVTPTVAGTTGPAQVKAAAKPTSAASRDNGFDYATAAGPVLGAAGSVRRFKVAVEQDRGLDANVFAAAVDKALGDPRSWVAAEQFRLQRVPRASGAEFTVFLASAVTSEKMCARGGMRTEGYTSCRMAGQVIINLDRWQQAIPDYGAPLVTYQAYAINHEVGHQLGQGHEACPGPGKLAPVMQQQTYGLKGCTANAWPYVDGRRYAGSPVS
jgi:hypothetical protein